MKLNTSRLVSRRMDKIFIISGESWGVGLFKRWLWANLVWPILSLYMFPGCDGFLCGKSLFWDLVDNEWFFQITELDLGEEVFNVTCRRFCILVYECLLIFGDTNVTMYYVSIINTRRQWCKIKKFSVLISTVMH